MDTARNHFQNRRLSFSASSTRRAFAVVIWYPVCFILRFNAISAYRRLRFSAPSTQRAFAFAVVIWYPVRFILRFDAISAYFAFQDRCLLAALQHIRPISLSLLINCGLENDRSGKLGSYEGESW